MSGLHVVSTCVLVLLVIGFAQRGDRRRHRALMLVAFALDLGLVVWIEATRSAVERVVAGVPALLAFHVAVSTGVLVCYLGMIGLGSRLINTPSLHDDGRFELRTWHRNLGITFVVLRGLNYVTSFLV
jgi:hypothetical protein